MADLYKAWADYTDCLDMVGKRLREAQYLIIDIDSILSGPTLSYFNCILIYIFLKSLFEIRCPSKQYLNNLSLSLLRKII